MTTVASTSKSTRLGATAMLLAIVVCVASVLTSIITCMIWGPLATRIGAGWADPLSLTSSNQTIVAVTVAQHLQLLLGSALGLWALVQGIVATAAKRGRKFGVTAIALSVLAPILSLFAAFISFSSTVPR